MQNKKAITHCNNTYKCNDEEVSSEIDAYVFTVSAI